MRFSAITTLCAAPLALAGTLEAGLAGRGLMAKREAPNVQVLQGQAGVAAAAAQGVSIGQGGAISVNAAAGVTTTEIIIVWVNNGGGAPTQTVNSAAAAAANPSSATHTVVVGGSQGLAYNPEQVVAAIGDMVIFEFQSTNHTATQSAFAKPCEALAGGMDTGFVPNINNSITPPPQMAMMVSVTTPLWFYCRQSGHCGKGMTFSINPQQGATGGNKTQAAFKQLAIAQNGKGTAPAIAGGAPAAAAPAASAAPAAAAPAAVAAPAAAAPPAAVAPAAGAGATMASGTGAVNNGACQCSCLCGMAAFPNAAVQGVGSYGGMPGAMPMSAIEAVPS